MHQLAYRLTLFISMLDVFDKEPFIGKIVHIECWKNHNACGSFYIFFCMLDRSESSDSEQNFMSVLNFFIFY